MSNREQDSAAELAAFVDGRLAGRPDAPTPNVDPQDLATSKALLGMARDVQPSPSFSSNLARELREHRYPVRGRRAFWSILQPLGRPIARLLVVVVALVLVAGGAVLLRRTGGDDPIAVVPSVSAAEVLSNMAAVAKDPYAKGLHSYQATSFYHGTFTNTLTVDGEMVAVHHTQDNSGTVWVRTPDKLRTEETVTLHSNGQSMSVPMQGIINKDSYWRYSPEGEIAVAPPDGEIVKGSPSAMRMDPYAQRAQIYYQQLSGGQSLEDVITGASADYEVTLLDADTVAGRPTYVLMLVARQDSPERASRLKLWVDQEFYVVLKREGSGGPWQIQDRLYEFSGHGGYSQIAFNVPLDGVDFTFTPPAGVEVVDLQQVIGSQEQWEEAARQLSFTILAPSHLPPGVKGFEPRTQVFRRKPQAYRYSYNLGEMAGITIYQTSARSPNLTGSECAVNICREGPGEAVDIDGAPGVYGVSGAVGWLRFERDGTYVEISTNTAMSDPGLREELLAIARSMEPVAKK